MEYVKSSRSEIDISISGKGPFFREGNERRNEEAAKDRNSNLTRHYERRVKGDRRNAGNFGKSFFLNIIPQTNFKGEIT